MLASLTLPLLLLLAPQEPRPTRPEEPQPRAAQARPADRAADKPAEKDAEKAGKATRRPKRKSRPSSRSTSCGSRAAACCATASRPGFMPLKNDAGDVEARVFFMAYTLDRTRRARDAAAHVLVQRRPGLVVGVAAPRRARAEAREDARRRRACRRRPTSWSTTSTPGSTTPTSSSSTRSGTGYSRPAKPELGKKFWGVQGDIESVGEFIRLYLTRYERWASPLFLVGESYGTTRAAGPRGPPGRPRHRLQRHPARLVDPQLPDRALHARATTCRIRCSCRPTPRPRGTTRSCPPTCRRSRSATSCARWRRSPAATTRARSRRATG